MKEAAGEANMTVIAIILIGVIAAVVTPMINSYMTSTAKKGCCSGAGYGWKNNKCYEIYSNGTWGTTDKTSAVWNDTSKSCTT